jgi:hypothetical protein
MGSGFRTFTAGEVLTASNVQNYLMDQSVMVFADSTARATNIGTANFEEGMVSYLENTDQLEVYNGTAWASIAPASTQGLTLLQSVTFSGVSSVSLPANTFTATYDNYRIILNCSATAQSFIQIRLRAAGSDNTTTNYFSGMNNTALVGGAITADPGGAVGTIMTRMGFCNTADSIDIFYDIYNPFATKKTGITGMQSRSDAILTSIGGFFQTTTSFDSLTFSGGTLTGSVSVYGYNK